MKRRYCAVAAVLLFGLAVSCSKTQPVKAASMKPAKDRKPAPVFSLKDGNGQNVGLEDLKGKVILLNFWATWCSPCKIEIPWFIEFEQQFKDRGFAVLGVSLDEEGWEAVRPYVARSRINYRVMVDSDEKVSKMYGPFAQAPTPEEPEPIIGSLPTSFIIDRAGRIASVHVGLVSKGNYENEIKTLLEDSPIVRGRAALPAILIPAR
ncbi:MAG: TlpA family protein disulfide reductase [Bryobacteraceae bacterium]